MTEKKNFDLSIFDRLRHFGAGNQQLNKVWVDPDRILLTEPKTRSIMYSPKERIFDSEFGINDLSKFVSVLSLFNDVTIELDMPKIVLKENDGSQRMVYNTSTKPAFERVIESNTKALALHKISQNFISDGNCFQFNLTPEIISKVSKAGSILGSATQMDSILHITKSDDTDDVLLMVTNEATETDNFSQKIKGVNAGNLPAFDYKIKVKHLLSGNWSFNVLPDKIEYNGAFQPVIWAYLINEDNNENLLIVYKQDVV